MSKFNVLITGSSGMVGQSLQQYIAQYNLRHKNTKNSSPNYYFLTREDCDLTNKAKLREIFKKLKVTFVVHLASKVGGLYMNMKHNVEMFMENMKINMNVIELCHEFNVNRGVFCLSSCIFPPEPKSFPMKEEYICDSPPHPSNEGYAYSKRMLYIMCKHYNQQYGRDYICVSPVNLYGAYDNFDINNSHVIPGIIHKMYLTKYQEGEYKKDTYEVLGTGKAQRQFLFAMDFACIIFKILWNKDIDKKNMLINICSDKEYTIKQVVQLIAFNLDYDIHNIVYNNKYSDGCIKKTVSNKLFRKFFPDHKFIPLEDGLDATISWFEKNYNKPRFRK